MMIFIVCSSCVWALSLLNIHGYTYVWPNFKNELNTLQVGEFTKEASVKWGAMNDVQKKKFNDLAAKDKARYNEEMQAFTGKPMKDENKPKRPQSAYFLFLADYRIKMKGSDISNKDLICSGK